MTREDFFFLRFWILPRRLRVFCGNKFIVRRIFEVVRNQNKHFKLDEYIPVHRVQYNGIAVHAGRGPDDLRQLIQIWNTGFPDFQYHILELFDEGEMAAANTTLAGTRIGVFQLGPFTLPPKGNSRE